MGNYLDKGGVTTLVKGLQSRFGAKADVDLLMGKQFPFAVSMKVTGPYFVEKGQTGDASISYSATKGGKDVTGQVQWAITKNGTLVQNPGNPIVLSKVADTTTIAIGGTLAGETKQAGSYTMKFVNAKYFRVVDANFTPTATNVIESGKLALTDSKAYDVTNVNLVNQKFMYAYPKAFGALTEVKDTTGLPMDLANDFTLTELTIKGETYLVYVKALPATNSGLAFHFK